MSCALHTFLMFVWWIQMQRRAFNGMVEVVCAVTVQRSPFRAITTSSITFSTNVMFIPLYENAAINSIACQNNYGIFFNTNSTFYTVPTPQKAGFFFRGRAATLNRLIERMVGTQGSAKKNHHKGQCVEEGTSQGNIRGQCHQTPSWRA